MRLLRLWLILALVPWLAGAACPEIYSEHPLGGEIAVLDPEKVNGTWVSTEGATGVRLLDAQKGMLISWPVGRNFQTDALLQCEPPPDRLRECSTNPSVCLWRRQPIPESQLYLYFFPNASKAGASGKVIYETVGAVLSDGESFAIGYPFDKPDIHLKELIETGTVPGHVESDGRVVLGLLLPEHYRLIFTRKVGLIDWTRPFSFVKLRDGLDPCKKSDLRK